MTVLDHAAQVASDQAPLVPGPGEFLYVREIQATIFGGGQSGLSWRYFLRVAAAVDYAIGRAWQLPCQVVGQPRFITASDRSAWEAAGSPPVRAGIASCGSDTYLNVSSLPRRASQIKAFLRKQTEGELGPPGTNRGGEWQFYAAFRILEAGVRRQRSEQHCCASWPRSPECAMWGRLQA